MISIMKGEAGISSKLSMQKDKSAKELKKFVDLRLNEVVKNSQEYIFALNLKESENQFAHVRLNDQALFLSF